MNHLLIIRVNEVTVRTDSVVDWYMFDQQGRLLHRDQAALHDVYEHIAEQDRMGLSISLIVPNDVVLLGRVSIPSANERHIKQALPYVVEEIIADEIENVHMALPLDRDNDESLSVAIVSHSFLIDCLDVLYHHNLNPQRIVVDTNCVPYKGRPAVLIEGDRVLFRLSKHQGVSCSIKDFPVVYNAAVSEQLVKESPQIVIAEGTLLDENCFSGIEGFTDWEYRYFKESCSETLAATLFRQTDTINLLQGGYKQGEGETSLWKAWRPFGYACAAALSLFIFTHLASGMYFNYKADEIYQQSITHYKRLFPNERRVISPKRQLQNQLRLSTVGGGQFLSLLSQVSGEFKNFSKNSSLGVNQMRFSEESRNLQFELKGDSIEQIDQLKQQLVIVGLKASIGSARVQDGSVISNMTVEAL